MIPEMSQVTSNQLENMCHNSFNDKNILGHGSDKFSNMTEGGHHTICGFGLLSRDM